VDCRSCGACCVYSWDWPEIWSNDDVPEEYVSDDGERVRCKGDRCTALQGEVGQMVKCVIYDRRPTVCRQFEPGSMDCRFVRDSVLGGL